MTNFDKGHTKYGLDADANLISAILGSMQNIREKDIEAAYVLIDNATEPTLDQVNKGSVPDVKHTMFFAYDDQGRIVAQRRAGNVGKSAGGEYTYEAGSNKLKSVTNGMGGTADSRNMTDANNFDYDADGNLIEDKSKNLTISYDWRGMPVEFVRETCTAYGHYTVCDSTKLVMAYDGSGRRISKTRMKKTAFDGPWYATLVTHYTGIGTEVRENMPGGTLKDVRVVVNMPQGLGRYMPEDASAVDIGFGAGYIPSEKFEWYLKNHLGSTMLVYGTQGYSWTDVADVGVPVAAYDYRAFGEQVSLAEPAEKVTENFTGKELDDEIELDYFGARYLDPMLGLWISVDPARFFSSSYVYMGNYYNPIKSIDEDGLDPEDGFNNMDAAVLDAGYFYQDQASSDNAEYAGLIYELDGLFYSTYGMKGTENTSYPYDAESQVPEGATVVANWHNHGRHLESYGSGNYEMSDDDYQNYKDHMIYMIPAKKAESSGLGRPVKKYDPVSGTESSIGYVDKFSVRNYVNSSRKVDNHNRAER